jgi:hypothetical protein
MTITCIAGLMLLDGKAIIRTHYTTGTPVQYALIRNVYRPWNCLARLATNEIVAWYVQMQKPWSRYNMLTCDKLQSWLGLATECAAAPRTPPLSARAEELQAMDRAE